MLKDDPSEKILVDLTEKMGASRTRLQVNRLQARLAVRKLLTEEQRDQMMLMDGQGRHGRQEAGRGRGGADQGDCDEQRGGRGRGQRRQ